MAFKRTDYKNMSTKKKSKKLFWGTLAPLLTVTFVACTFFYNISNKIIEYYLNAELSRQVERVNSNVLERMNPVMVNIEDFANFAELTDDDEIMQPLVITFMKNLPYASGFYYTSKTSTLDGGLFVHSGGWIPPKNWDQTTREWYKLAMHNPNELCFTSPFVDADTGELAITISKTVKDMQGKVKGVVACDILLSRLVTLFQEITISKHGQINMIDKDGYYMTHVNSAKIMKDNYFNETSFKGNMNEWMNGELKSLVTNKNFYAICKIGYSPWFIVIEGPVNDFKGQLVNIIIIFEIALAIFSILAAIYNIDVIRKMRKGEQEIGKTLFEETQNLVVSAKENAATAQDQSAAVKEIVATMEDSNALSENIASKIHDVSKVAEKTSSDVATGVASIEQNVAQLHAIFDANQQTIDGMKILSERIESIWDIVTLINNVADQAKIIAFNAELEASSAGEAGKSFRIVANEIRRLSDGIIDGTKEIKERITEIQHSSDSLILASESGTKKINEGYENAKNLGEMFASIKNSAEVTANSAGDITSIIQQQTTASEQILIALKQISAGVENFTVATDNISSSSEHIRAMSEAMNNSVKASEKQKSNNA